MREKSEFVLYGIKYIIYPPEECQDCCHWKPGKGKCCKIGKPCPYLIREIDNWKTCIRCAYSRDIPCTGEACYKDLITGMNRKRV